MMRLFRHALLLCLFCSATPAFAGDAIIGGDTGYRLWLKYDALPEIQRRNYLKSIKSWYVAGNSDTHKVIRTELEAALPSLLASDIKEHTQLRKQQLVVLTRDQIAASETELLTTLNNLGDEGYVLRQGRYQGRSVMLVAANTPVAALYGTYALLREMQTGTPLNGLATHSTPALQLRVLNHWDDLDRHVERGFAGESLWDWHKLPVYEYQRYHDYARANASIGINGTVLNNVNADPLILSPLYLEKVEALADTFRPYGLRVYLSVKFNSPQSLGGLDTADPFDPRVEAWWKDKVADIYQRIPDFGGFLVKANSEGQPGPGDYGRSHADGANMLARVLAPHNGVVMWRAFVYANEKNEERSKQAYSEFTPLDGKFEPNVLVQVKNGPIDFQPREPFSPLFGAMPNTPLMMEFQITMEYLGFSTHWVYLGTLFEEVLDADTYIKGPGSTVAKVIDGQLHDYPITGMAGVANIGTDPNWTGHPILQSNWFAYGRFAWDPTLSAESIAQNWTRMSLTREPAAVDEIVDMMMQSRETTVSYMTPLGLHHIMGADHHYGPAPWVDFLGRDDWNSVYYHRADTDGIGFDRSPSGVDAVSQYASPLREELSKPETTPEPLLLWFHHLPWDYTLADGRTLWDALVQHYYQGADDVAEMTQRWAALKGQISPLIHKQVSMSLQIQLNEARWWRDACVLYFQQYSGMPLPKGLAAPQADLDTLKQKQFPHAPGQG